MPFAIAKAKSEKLTGTRHVFRTVFAYAGLIAFTYAVLTPKSVADDAIVQETSRSCDVFGVDHFVLNHLVAWAVATIWLRSPYLAYALSVWDEIIEVSFQRAMPNYSECWWDRFLLDLLGANLIGVCIGARLLRRFQTDVLPYHNYNVAALLATLSVRMLFFNYDFMYKLFVFDPPQTSGLWTCAAIVCYLWRTWFTCERAINVLKNQDKVINEFSSALGIALIDHLAHLGWGSYDRLGPVDLAAFGTLGVGTFGFVCAWSTWAHFKKTKLLQSGMGASTK